LADHPAPNESWLEFFKRTGRFSDLILTAWSNIEFNIDQLVARQYGLFVDNDRKSKFLLDTSFHRKLEFLKDCQVFTGEEYAVIKDFQNYRNRLFHGKEWSYMVLSKDEEEAIMDNAMKAARITLEKLAS